MATGGTVFNSTDALIDGQSYFGALTVNGCDSTTRLEVIVTIANTPPPTTTAVSYTHLTLPTICSV